MPAYLFLSLGSVAAIAITMTVDEEKFTPLAIVLFAVFAVATVAVLLCLRPLRKRQARRDLAGSGLLQPPAVRERYKFTAKRGGAGLPKLVEWAERCCNFSPTAEIEITAEGVEIEGHFPCRKDGPYDGRFFWKDIRVYLQTSCADMQAAACFCLAFSDDKDLFLYLPVNAETVGMVKTFRVAVQNKGQFEYLLAHPEDAFYQIVTYGTIKKTDKFLKEKK